MFAVETYPFEKTARLGKEGVEELIKFETRDKKTEATIHDPFMEFDLPMSVWVVDRQKMLDSKSCIYDEERQVIGYKRMSNALVQFLADVVSEEIKAQLPLVLAESEKLMMEREFQHSKQTFESNAELTNINATLEDVRALLVEKDLHSKQSRNISKPHRKFDAADFSTYDVLPDEDIERSRNNVMSIVSDGGKNIDTIVKQVTDIDIKIKLISKELTAIDAQLKGDLSEKDFKDIKLSLDYRQSKIDKLLEQKNTLLTEKLGLENNVEIANKKLRILNLCVDRESVDIEYCNLEKRKNRALVGLRKILEDRAALETMRTNINDAWLDSTGSQHELVPALNILKDAEIIFV